MKSSKKRASCPVSVEKSIKPEAQHVLALMRPHLTVGYLIPLIFSSVCLSVCLSRMSVFSLLLVLCLISDALSLKQCCCVRSAIILPHLSFSLSLSLSLSVYLSLSLPSPLSVSPSLFFPPPTPQLCDKLQPPGPPLSLSSPSPSLPSVSRCRSCLCDVLRVHLLITTMPLA